MMPHALIAVLLLGISLYMFWQAYRYKAPALKTRLDVEDPDYTCAIQQARDTLDIFNDLRLKFPRAAIIYLAPLDPEGKTHPHFVQTVHSDGSYTLLAAPPKNKKGAADPAPFHCTKENIIDWSVTESDSKMHGAFVLRTLLRKNNVPTGGHFMSIEDSRATAFKNKTF